MHYKNICFSSEKMFIAFSYSKSRILRIICKDKHRAPERYLYPLVLRNGQSSMF